jgi:uncharacterized membrane protein YdcZ (DUF606 family)
MRNLILGLLLFAGAGQAATLVMNKDVATNAAIALSKLAALSANSVVVTDGSGLLAQHAAIPVAKALISDANGQPSAGGATSAELAFLSGVSSAIQTQLNAKISSGTGAIVNADVNAAAAIALSKLAALSTNSVVVTDGSGVLTVHAAIPTAKALISDSNGQPSASATTSAELGFVAGVTSAIQTQINAKMANVTPSATNGAVLTSINNAWVASTIPVVACSAISGTSVDWSLGNCFTKTLSANTVLTFANKTPGQTIVLRIQNTAANYTLTFPNTNTAGNSVMWAASTIPTLTTGGRRRISLLCSLTGPKCTATPFRISDRTRRRACFVYCFFS